MSDQEILTTTFQEHRPRLEGVAYRMLGSRSEAEDAVQDVWMRLDRSDHDAIENLGRLADHRDGTRLPEPAARPPQPPGGPDGSRTSPIPSSPARTRTARSRRSCSQTPSVSRSTS